MKRNIGLISLLLTVIMVVGCLSACGQSKETVKEEPQNSAVEQANNDNAGA